MSAPCPLIDVYPAGHGQWGFAAGAVSGTGYSSKAEAKAAGEAALAKKAKKSPCPLAVMDAIAHSVEQALVPGNDYRREFRAIQHAIPEARAAVAELVKAAQDYAWVIENAYDVTQTAPALARLRAAIAKFGGAA